MNCSILYNDKCAAEKIEAFISRTHFLTLVGSFDNPTSALSACYEHNIQLLFADTEFKRDIESLSLGLCVSREVRVIFFSKDGLSAMDCFRLDALDYILYDCSYSTFLNAVSKALRWFDCSKGEQSKEISTTLNSHIYVRSEYKIVKVDYNDINYIEGMGDYVKIYCRNSNSPIISLCCIKDMINVLPPELFMRVHRSYIVNKFNICIIERGSIIMCNNVIPIGATYKDQVKKFIDGLPIL